IVATLPLIALLRVPGIEVDRPSLTLLCIGVAAGLTAISLYRWLSPAAKPTSTDAGRVVFGLGVVLLWAAYAAFFSRLSIVNHQALNTSIADLGYYDNIFYQTLHGTPLGCSFMQDGVHYAGHFDPILVLLSPLYLL